MQCRSGAVCIKMQCKGVHVQKRYAAEMRAVCVNQRSVAAAAAARRVHMQCVLQHGKAARAGAYVC